MEIDQALYNLFVIEVESASHSMTQEIIKLEKEPDNQAILNSLMRSAHSIKGASRVTLLDPLVHLAHAMEDCFVSAIRKIRRIDANVIDRLLLAIDFFEKVIKTPKNDILNWLDQQKKTIEDIIEAIMDPAFSIPIPFLDVKIEPHPSIKETQTVDIEFLPSEEKKGLKIDVEKEKRLEKEPERMLKVAAKNLNRLMGLAGDSLVESRWLHPFYLSLQKLKKSYNFFSNELDQFRESLFRWSNDEDLQYKFSHLQKTIADLNYDLTDRLIEFDNFIRRHASLSDRLYHEVINNRMRPFEDLAEIFPRMVRDLARQLGKKVSLEIEGKSTPVDREILEKLEAPIAHLIRNSIDHGIESPEERKNLGKPVEGKIKLEAKHRGGILSIHFQDDGRGVNLKKIREMLEEKELVEKGAGSRLTDQEALDFLFLPGFSTAEKVTEISGRGVGLNVVASFVHDVGGFVRIINKPGEGIEFFLQLPLTLSVMRTLIVEISDHTYGFPLGRIEHTIFLDKKNIQIVEDRQFFVHEQTNIALFAAWEILELEKPKITLYQYPIVILNARDNYYGVVVDKIWGEKELVVQEIGHRFGKIKDVLAGALMEDGSPVLILDIEDMIRSIDEMIPGAQLSSVSYEKSEEPTKLQKTILVVDDSLTVREVECRLLQNQGYSVQTAVNGMDAWNAVRLGNFDLVITDIDMPRMDGIKLVKAIKNDPLLKNIPIMIVTYKDSEEDRLSGLNAGADYYLTKSSFYDKTLIDAVEDLIGKP